MSDGAVLGLAAVTLAIIVAGLFRLVAVLDSLELTLRRLVAGVWSARRTVAAAAELAASVERDAARGREELDRLRRLQYAGADRDGSGRRGGPVALPFRPGTSK